MSVMTDYQPTTSAPSGSRGSLVSDTLAVFQREMYLVLRDPFSVIFSLVQPLVFLGLFGTLLAGSVDAAVLGGGSPLQWFLPGVIVMICLFGTGVAGSNLLFEITLGSYERVLVIDHGQIIADDTAANLKATLAGDRIAVTVDPADADAAAAILAQRGRDVTRSEDVLGVVLAARFEQGTRTLPGLLAAVHGAGIEVRAADVRVPTLDDVFLSLTGRSLREESEVVAA